MLMRCLGVLGERTDPQAVHHARTEVRRLRSVLRTFAPIVERSWSEGWRARLDDFGRNLGTARDAAAMTETLRDAAGHLSIEQRERLVPVLDPFVARAREAERALGAFLETEAVRRLLRDLAEAAEVPHLGEKAAEPLQSIVPRIMRRLRRDTCRRARRAREHPSDRRLHRLRIAAKHLRYAAETLSDAYGKDARRFSKLAARLQTILGEERDATAALRAIAGRSDGKSPLCLVEAYLAEVARREAARWTKHWKRLEKRKNRFWKVER